MELGLTQEGPTIRPTLIALASVLTVPVTVAAQREPSTLPSPPAVFPVATGVVGVTVTVRDREGHSVPDLDEKDFAVLEDGRPQRLQVFARSTGPGDEPERALDVGVLFDTSESMTTELKLSQEALIRFLEAIPRARELYAIFFDHDIRLSRYDGEQQQGLIGRILETKGGGGTALYDAIAVYISRIQDSTGRRVLVLFTDGEDTTSSLSLSELVRLVGSSNLTIYSIAFSGFPSGSPRALPATAFLRQMAELTGGDVYHPSASRDLPGIYTKILDALSAQYVLGYVSDKPSNDGRFRKLRVEVKRQGFTARHRTGYYAPRK